MHTLATFFSIFISLIILFGCAAAVIAIAARLTRNMSDRAQFIAVGVSLLALIAVIGTLQITGKNHVRDSCTSQEDGDHHDTPR